MRPYANISQIKDANRALGHHYFERSTMSFFHSRVEGRSIYGGRYFITSECHPIFGRSGEWGPRKFTIRDADDDGSVSTVGEFMGYAFLDDARDAAKALARATHTVSTSAPDDDDTCECEHSYGEHDNGHTCRASTLSGRARCSCPSFKAALIQ